MRQKLVFADVSDAIICSWRAMVSFQNAVRRAKDHIRISLRCVGLPLEKEPLLVRRALELLREKYKNLPTIPAILRIRSLTSVDLLLGNESKGVAARMISAESC